MPADEELSETVAALHARIDAQIARSRALAEESSRLNADVEQTTATVTSPDGRVTVVARPNGAIDEVRLSATEGDAAGLARVITTTIAKAQRAAADSVLASMASTLGEDSPLVAAVRQDVDAAFPGGRGDTIEYR
ncbi:YbaB/EbfC family nucleoid-associated protein [Microbacterium sp. 3J1]|uniref:YbaB/EbfC family nucleoid-associated protein n=1 Tax=Microbacterium sp. 3J1 TaxID=861269 RepID=UPI000AB86C06|nr:YbaB/EbfC family nucleoid-associated protein [Microbacterium sp. 3J1]